MHVNNITSLKLFKTAADPRKLTYLYQTDIPIHEGISDNAPDYYCVFASRRK